MARWQKVWPYLSKKDKRRLVRYAGAGPSDLRRMRYGMFLPKINVEKLKRLDKVQNHLFFNMCRQLKDIRVMNSHVHPHAQITEGSDGYIGMPKDPIIEAFWGKYCLKSVTRFTGFYRMAVLAHEQSELYVLRKKSTRRGQDGVRFRKQRSITDGYCDHSSAHPLIAEANVSGGHPGMLKAMIHEWKASPAQKKVFSLLKQYGWTPVTGLPMYGRIANKVQRATEKIYKPFFLELIDRQLSRLERRYKGRALRKRKEGILAEAREYAGGRGLRKKYL